jgi:polyhydroxyalkanoate synthase subunit PhaC
MTRTEMTVSELDERADRAAPLDALLVDAALGPMRRLAPNASTVRFAARLARDPVVTSRRLGSLAAELARVCVGRSTIAPSKRDRRFTDPAWSQNPMLYRAVRPVNRAEAAARVREARTGWAQTRRGLKR